MSFRSGVEWITPAWAEKVLEENNHRNRHLSLDWARTLSRLILEGKFKLTHQGIAFNCDGTLRDGQHRLKAVVLAGVPVQMMVTYGLEDEAMDWIDTQRIRSHRDNLCLDGSNVTTNHAAICKAMLYEFGRSGKTSKVDRDYFRDFYRKHQQAIDWSYSLGSQPAIRISAVKAVLARAWYSSPIDKLEDFAKIVSTGQYEGKQKLAAVTLRNMLLGWKTYGGAGTLEVYRKTQNALQSFLNDIPLQKIYATNGILFRIPGDPEE